MGMIKETLRRLRSGSDEAPLLLLLVFSSGLFLIGLFMPLMTISSFVFIKNEFSIVSGLYELLRKGNVLLFILITGFSILLPVFKLVILFKLLSNRDTPSLKVQRQLKLMHEYGRWAMLDVLVVAILVVTVKLGAIATVKIHLGLFVFGSAVVLIMLLTSKIVRLKEKALGKVS